MTTSDIVVDVGAACQVAHAISTHETLIESDYFTALDDLQQSFITSQTAATSHRHCLTHQPLEQPATPE